MNTKKKYKLKQHMVGLTDVDYERLGVLSEGEGLGSRSEMLRRLIDRAYALRVVKNVQQA